MDISTNQLFRQASPRFSPRPAGWQAYAIWGGTMLLYAALLAQAFIRTGIGAWGVGLVYIAYDTALLFFVAYQTHKIGTTHAPRPLYRPKLTAIIAAFNEADALISTIEALRRQSDPPDRIIIADDGSNDASAELLEQHYGLHPPVLGMLGPVSIIAEEIRWLRLSHGGKARALNAALALAETDLIVTVDADTLAAPHAIAAMRAAFAREPGLVAATGVLTPACTKGWSGRMFQWFQRYEYVRNFLARHAWMRMESLLLISGAFAGFRREALLKIGGFDSDCLVEDYEIIHRLHRYSVERELGWNVRVLGDAQARTDAPGALIPFLRQRRRWFAGFLQTQWWNRDMIGDRRFGKLGLAMLPVKALDTLQPIYGLTAFALLILFLITGHATIAVPILIAMGAKIAIDFGWLALSLRRYARWTGERPSLGGALLVAVIEPFSFQLLRHAGAAWGWLSLLRRRQAW